jgi:D-alanine-D-alanine ligase
MKKIRLALLSGGISSEREVSLNSGNQVFEALDKEKYDIVRYDPKTDLKKLVMDAGEIDVALIILHGPFGEDGTIQGMLDLLDIPYQGAGLLGSSLAMNKKISKTLYEAAGIPIPSYCTFSVNDKINLSSVIDTLGLPLVVKPVCAGSSVGMSIVRHENALDKAVKLAFEHDKAILIEKYIKGIELTCGVLGNENPAALPVIEIIPGEAYDFFDYKAKYVPGATQEICPARIDEEITAKVKSLAVKAHQSLFLKGYSRTDMILSGKDLFVLETNTIPGMTATSLYPQSAKVAGLSFTKLLDRLIELALEERFLKVRS